MGGDAVETKKQEIEKVEETRKFRQFVRIRPFIEAEKNHNKKSEKPQISTTKSAVETKDGKDVLFMDPKCLTEPKPMAKVSAKKTFTGYEKVFWSFGKDPWVQEGRSKSGLEAEDYDHTYVDQEAVYNEVKGELVKKVYDGFNQTVASFGPINGGKTFTMFGTESQPGLVPRLLRDLVDALPKEREARQAPGEALTITLEARCWRIYQEVIEDVFAGPHVLSRGNYQTLAHTDAQEKATIFNVHDPAEMKKLEERLWATKESVRRVVADSGPNKNNRSSVVLSVTVHHKSLFEADGEEKVETEKSATLFFADIGYGGKAESESPLDFKKINQANQAFSQVLRKLGEYGQKQAEAVENDKKAGGNGSIRVSKKSIHVPYNNSNLTRLLTDAFDTAHVTLICNISPFHKDHTETANFLELASYAGKALSTAVQEQSKELGEFREKLEERFEMERRVHEEQKAAQKVQGELEHRANQINQLSAELKEAEEDEQALRDEIADLEARTASLAHRLRDQKRAKQRLFESLDSREKKARADEKECNEKSAALRVEIERLTEELASKRKRVDEALALVQRAAGLKSLLTGEAMPKDANLKTVNDDEIDAAREAPVTFDEDAEKAISTLQEAVRKFEQVAEMNEENTKLLKELQETMGEADTVEDEMNSVKEVIKRGKRNCLRELAESLEAVQQGPLEKLSSVVNTYTNNPNHTEHAGFFHDEIDGANKVLFSGLDDDDDDTPAKSVPPPGWCKYSEVRPVRPWLRSLKAGENLNATTGSLEDGTRSLEGTAKEGHARYRVEGVTNAEIDSMKELVSETSQWLYAVIKFQRGRKTIESARDEWIERMPKWPEMATKGLQLLADAKAVDEQEAQLRKEIAGVEAEIKTEESNLAGEKKNVAKLEADKKRLEAELQKLRDKCLIL